MHCSTVYPGLSEELAAKAKSAGVYYLAAPIFGRPKAIAGHSGICTCSGEAIARERASGPIALVCSAPMHENAAPHSPQCAKHIVSIHAHLCNGFHMLCCQHACLLTCMHAFSSELVGVLGESAASLQRR